MQSIIQNDKYEVLTPSGWSKFNGIKRTTTKSIVTLVTEHGNILETTLNHRIKIDDSFCESQNINVGQEISSIRGLDKVIYTKIDNNDNEIFVYDLLDVENGNIYYTNNIVSHNCEFESTSTTLISYNALKVLLSKVELPLPGSDLHLKIYEEPKEKHKYITCVDCARGMGMDYSTFSVVDITSIPYKQVATYRNNTIVAMVFPEVIYRVSKQYNNAEVLVEINDIGGQVADILYEDYEYENVISTSSSGGSQQISGNYDTSTKLGVKTSSTVKNLGCSNLKALVEHQQIIIPDRETVDELVYFSRKGRTFEAIVGHHDDMVISLVLFGWLTTQSYFKEMNENVNIRKTLHEMNQKQIEDSLTLVGFFDNGSDSGEDDDGWVTVKNPGYYGF